MIGRYLIVQIDMSKDVKHMHGVLHPVNCDGYYSDQATAQEVADYLAGVNPTLRTHVVEVKS